jgi:uncharacterized protein (DUF1697 family)
MNVYIALYRGINVVGKNSVKMESLRAMHERLGHRNVASYIQSGNVIFSANGLIGNIQRKVAAEFANEFGFAARVVLIDAKKVASIVKGNPYASFAAENHKIVHAAICDGQPDAKGLKALLVKTGGSENFVVKQRVIYLHVPDGFGTSKFAAAMEKASGVPMTVRNWRTIESLSKLAAALTAAPARNRADDRTAGR